MSARYQIVGCFNVMNVLKAKSKACQYQSVVSVYWRTYMRCMRSFSASELAANTLLRQSGVTKLVAHLQAACVSNQNRVSSVNPSIFRRENKEMTVTYHQTQRPQMADYGSDHTRDTSDTLQEENALFQSRSVAMRTWESEG
jgi:hypothetical protein